MASTRSSLSSPSAPKVSVIKQWQEALDCAIAVHVVLDSELTKEGYGCPHDLRMYLSRHCDSVTDVSTGLKERVYPEHFTLPQNQYRIPGDDEPQNYQDLQTIGANFNVQVHSKIVQQQNNQQTPSMPLPTMICNSTFNSNVIQQFRLILPRKSFLQSNLNTQNTYRKPPDIQVNGNVKISAHFQDCHNQYVNDQNLPILLGKQIKYDFGITNSFNEVALVAKLFIEDYKLPADNSNMSTPCCSIPSSTHPPLNDSLPHDHGGNNSKNEDDMSNGQTSSSSSSSSSSNNNNNVENQENSNTNNRVNNTDTRANPNADVRPTPRRNMNNLTSSISVNYMCNNNYNIDTVGSTTPLSITIPIPDTPPPKLPAVIEAAISAANRAATMDTNLSSTSDSNNDIRSMSAVGNTTNTVVEIESSTRPQGSQSNENSKVYGRYKIRPNLESELDSQFRKSRYDDIGNMESENWYIQYNTAAMLELILRTLENTEYDQICFGIPGLSKKSMVIRKQERGFKDNYVLPASKLLEQIKPHFEGALIYLPAFPWKVLSSVYVAVSFAVSITAWVKNWGKRDNHLERFFDFVTLFSILTIAIFGAFRLQSEDTNLLHNWITGKKVFRSIEKIKKWYRIARQYQKWGLRPLYGSTDRNYNTKQKYQYVDFDAALVATTQELSWLNASHASYLQVEPTGSISYFRGVDSEQLKCLGIFVGRKFYLNFSANRSYITTFKQDYSSTHRRRIFKGEQIKTATKLIEILKSGAEDSYDKTEVGDLQYFIKGHHLNEVEQ